MRGIATTDSRCSRAAATLAATPGTRRHADDQTGGAAPRGHRRGRRIRSCGQDSNSSRPSCSNTPTRIWCATASTACS